MRRLLVIVPDYISAILKKGEYQPRYYNPGEVFDEVHILMTNPDRPDPAALQRTVGRARVVLHNLPESHSLPRAWPGWLARRILERWAGKGVELARRIGPDLIRCHGADWNAFLACRIKAALGIPYVVSLHINPDINPPRRHAAPANSAERRHNAFFEHMEVAGLLGADLVMPVYKPIIPYLERLGVDRYEVCYNVLNQIHLREKTDYGLHDPVRLVYIGRLFDDKNPENIIRAVADIPGAHYTIVGDGPKRQDLEALVRELGVERRVEFIPAIANDELCRRLPEFDIYAIHSEYAELNKSTLEALLTGLPVVINRRRGIPVPELADADFVRLVDNTSESYRQAIEGLLRDHAGREALGRRAFDHARALWGTELTEAKYAGIYRRFLGEGKDNG